MDERKKYLFGFFAICIAFALTLQITVLLMVFAHLQWLSRVLPVEVLIAVVALFWWIRRFRGRLPKPSQTERRKAARNARNIAVFCIVAPALGYLSQGSDFFKLPYGIGFILPIIPLSLAVYYLRLSARLRKTSDDEPTFPVTL
jgi:uncharacterized iron-regulated membrane protein